MKKNEKKKDAARKGQNSQYVQITRKQAAGWIGAFMFLLVWIFILGVMVGRGTAPMRFDMDKLQKDLADLKAEVLKKEQTIIKNQAEELLEKKEFEFHKELTSSEDLIKAEAQARAPIENKTKPAIKAKEKQTVQKTPSPEKKKAVAAASGEYALQVASLKDVKYADTLVKRLNSKGYPAYHVSADLLDKGIWYRVRIGPLKTKTQAFNMLKTVKKEYKTAIVIKK